MVASSLAPDEPLVAAARAGDRVAFAHLIARHRGQVHAAARAACGDAALADDLTQDAIVIAWVRLPALEQPDRFAAWLCGIARNLARAHRRWLGRHRTDEAVDVGDVQAGPLERAIGREELARAWDALQRLPARYREPLLLLDELDGPHARVGRALGLGEVAVRQRVSRARRQLRERLVERRRLGPLIAALATAAAAVRSAIALPRWLGPGLAAAALATATVAAVSLPGAPSSAKAAVARAVRPSSLRAIEAGEAPPPDAIEAAPPATPAPAPPARAAKRRLRHGPATILPPRARPSFAPPARAAAELPPRARPSFAPPARAAAELPPLRLEDLPIEWP